MELFTPVVIISLEVNNSILRHSKGVECLITTDFIVQLIGASILTFSIPPRMHFDVISKAIQWYNAQTFNFYDSTRQVFAQIANGLLKLDRIALSPFYNYFCIPENGKLRLDFFQKLFSISNFKAPSTSPHLTIANLDIKVTLHIFLFQFFTCG